MVQWAAILVSSAASLTSSFVVEVWGQKNKLWRFQIYFLYSSTVRKQSALQWLMWIFWQLSEGLILLQHLVEMESNYSRPFVCWLELDDFFFLRSSFKPQWFREVDLGVGVNGVLAALLPLCNSCSRCSEYDRYHSSRLPAIQNFLL